MSLLDLDVDALDCFKILCIKHMKKQLKEKLQRDVEVVYENPNFDIHDALQTPDNYALGVRWNQLGGFYRIKVLPYKKPTISKYQLEHGYYKNSYLLSINNLLSIILNENH